jgi:outer membrane immunogenic protein
MMRRISLSLLAATAMGLIASQAASAADLRVPMKAAPAPLPPPVQDWSGIYVGLEGGYGWGKQNFSNFDPFFASSEIFFCGKECGPNAAINSVSQSGWLAGGFVGAQKQWGSWVLGIEADFDAADIKGSTTAVATPFALGTSSINQHHTINTKIDELGTVRGKVGWAWSPNWMIYGTGGLAFAHVQTDFSASQNFCFTPGDCLPGFDASSFDIGGVSGSGGVSMLGWTVGAGLDYKWQIDQNSAVIFGFQYLHYQFDNHSLTFGPLQRVSTFNNETSTFTIGDMSQTIDVIKGRISYLFSIH